MEECNHKWSGCVCTLCGKTRWLLPVEEYNFDSINEDELINLIEKMIEKNDDLIGINSKIINHEQLVNEMTEYLHIPQEKYEMWAERFVKDYFEIGSPDYTKWVNNLINFWKSQEKVPPFIDFNYNDDGSRRGFIANSTNIFFNKPKEWKELIKSMERL